MKPPVITSEFKQQLASIQQDKIGPISVYSLNDEGCELSKLEWVFQTGTTSQSKSLQANFSANLLLEGTSQHDSNTFARLLDEYGAYFGVECGKDFTSFTLYVLASNLAPVLDIVLPIFHEPLFSEKEFNSYKKESKEEFEQNLHNGAFIARQQLRKNLYHNHAYGQLAELSSFDKITNEDAIDFANEYFIQKQYKLFISGKANDDILNLVSSKISSISYSPIDTIITNSALSPIVGLSEIAHKTAKQDSVRIGFNIPNQSSEDYLKINLLNTILGGYFGSRLMQNIREEKGWTYGINSTILPGKLASSLFISTDVLNGKGQDTIQEINNELSHLASTTLSNGEFQKVSSYIKGNLLRSFDGVFEQMDRFQSCFLYDLSTQHYLDYLHLLNSISPKEIRDTASKYFTTDQITKVIVHA